MLNIGLWTSYTPEKSSPAGSGLKIITYSMQFASVKYTILIWFFIKINNN